MSAAQATAELGESCPGGDGAQCHSGICLHTQPEPDTGYFCTQRCKADPDCPRDWRCVQVVPSAGGELCVPPEGWTGAVAEPR